MNKIEREPRHADFEKGTENMSASSVKCTIIAVLAALTMSVLTVGATVSPVQAHTLQVSRVTHA